MAGTQRGKAKPPTYPKLKIKFPSIGLVGIQLVERQYKPSFEVGDNLEVLFHDSGMTGYWFRCKVLQVSEKHLKDQYDDFQDCDGPEKLEERIPSYRVAGSDKLGVRCTERLTIRPLPLDDSSDYSSTIRHITKHQLQLLHQKNSQKNPPLGPNCEASCAFHAQFIRACNSLGRNPFL